MLESNVAPGGQKQLSISFTTSLLCHLVEWKTP